MNLFDLSGQVALVTGATSGLGLAIAQTMARHGASVVVSGLEQSDCDRVAGELQIFRGGAIGLACDVADRKQVARLADAVVGHHGRIDTLVCNAGVQGPAGPSGDVLDTEWDHVMDVNVRSATWLTSAVVPGMAVRHTGSVILISSIAGLRGNKSIGLYGMSKAALSQLARNLAVEWGPSGVRANAISPGLIRTPLSRELMQNDSFMLRRIAATPLRRVGEPEEIAGVVVMLASRAGGFVTGQNLVVDGGTLISDGN